jgi:polysaccharide export outer membrane protein
MNHLIKLLFVVLLVNLFSCRSSQELVYLNDASDKEKLSSLPVQSAEHVLKPSDIRYISIKTMNPEVNSLFNPESSMDQNSGASRKFESPNGAYLYGYEVDPKGSIKLPMLGSLKVAGYTVEAVEPLVQKKADEFIKDAIVKVKLLNFKITVMGEVKSPGIYYIYNNSITVLEAIAMASGNSDYAKIKNVMVMRKTTEGNQSFLLDLSKKDVFMSEAFLLHPDDYVILQPDKSKDLQLNSAAISLFFSSVALILTVVTIVLL